MELPEADIEEFYVVGEFGHGAHRGAGGAHRVFAVDGYGRWDILDAVHLRPVHALHELPRIGRKGLDIAALALSIKRVKGKGRLTRTTHPCDHGDMIKGNFQVQILEIILAGTFELDEPLLCVLPV